ncbi:MAG: nuclear transport factor 2 family protein [Acidimicrobiales bacterium]
MSGLDEEGIRQTLARYCQLCDDGRFEEFAALWTDEAVFSVPGRDAVVGRGAIRAFMEKAQPPERRGKHMCSNSIIDVQGDEARVVSDYVFVAGPGGAYTITSAGRYHDRIVRDPETGDWHFAQRRIEFAKRLAAEAQPFGYEAPG